MLRFHKYEGLGNDFVIVDATEGAALRDPAISARICDRHLGIGADGILFLERTASALGMTVVNADGSIPEMCGNGIRCIALHLARSGSVNSESFDIDTDAGPHTCRVLQSGSSGRVEVSMRAPSTDPEAVPVDAPGPVIDALFDVEQRRLHVTAISMGNPHVVTFDEVGDRRLVLGPSLEKHKRFPEGANAGFARMREDGGLDVDVWERGVGWTRACGTGACAAAAAAVETGRAPRHEVLSVTLPGGTLEILVGDPGQRLRMTGPARHVFSGDLEL